MIVPLSGTARRRLTGEDGVEAGASPRAWRDEFASDQHGCRRSSGTGLSPVRINLSRSCHRRGVDSTYGEPQRYTHRFTTLAALDGWLRWSAGSTQRSRSGARRIRTPVASKIALATAASRPSAFASHSRSTRRWSRSRYRTRAPRWMVRFNVSGLIIRPLVCSRSPSNTACYPLAQRDDVRLQPHCRIARRRTGLCQIEARHARADCPRGREGIGEVVLTNNSIGTVKPLTILPAGFRHHSLALEIAEAASLSL